MAPKSQVVNLGARRKARVLQTREMLVQMRELRLPEDLCQEEGSGLAVMSSTSWREVERVFAFFCVPLPAQVDFKRLVDTWGHLTKTQAPRAIGRLEDPDLYQTLFRDASPAQHQYSLALAQGQRERVAALARELDFFATCPVLCR